MVLILISMSLSDGHKNSTTSTCVMSWLFPVRTVMSVVYQGHGSEVSWKCDGDPQPGEKVLLDIKVRRGLEWRLQEIQQQLEILGQSHEMTVSSKQLHDTQQTHPSVYIHTLSVSCIVTLHRSVSVHRHMHDELCVHQGYNKVTYNVSAGP